MWPKAMSSSTLRSAATGQVGFCSIPQVDALLEEAAQTRTVHSCFCNSEKREVIEDCT